MKLNMNQKYLILLFLLLLIPVLGMTVGMYGQYSQEHVEYYRVRPSGPATAEYSMGDTPLLEHVGIVVGVWSLFLVFWLWLLSEKKVTSG